MNTFIFIWVNYVIINYWRCMNVAKVRMTITIDDELLKEVTELAEEEERSISQQIVYFIKLGMKKGKP